jgi:putative membrane protein
MQIMKSLNKSAAAVSFAGLMLMSPMLLAQSGPPPGQPQPAGHPQPTEQPAGNAAMSAGGDAHFVMAASAAGDTEILASRLAQSHAQSDKTKSFAATMIRDHTAANDKLRTIAQKGGFTLAGVAMVQQQPELAKLESLHGADFDKAYASMMQQDHQDAVTLFTSESSTGTNPDLKAFAAQTLPTLQHHLSMAQAL